MGSPGTAQPVARHRVIGENRIMKLYLSSYRFGDRPDLLLAMVEKGARAGVIANAVELVAP
jgi:hypothetical protein